MSATANWTQNYGYDRYGNKTATTNTGYTANNQAIPLDGLPSQSFDTSSNRINEAGYDYDKAGNLIRGKAPNGSWQKYEYDTAGRLRYVRDDTGWIQQSNEYAASRERLSSWSYASADITYFAWGGSSVLAEYSTQYSSSTLTWQKSSVYAGSRLLSTITNTSGNEVTEYHHPDRLGTRLISNPITATQNEQLTLPFGTLIGAETSATNDKRFTSYDRSEIAGGLDYAVNRNYNSGQSRFTQVDPIGMASASIGDPQSMNMFAYVQNNPIDFVDPSGLLLEGPFRGVRCSLLGYVNDQPRYLCYSADDPWYASPPGGSGGFGGSRGGGSPPQGEPRSKCPVQNFNFTKGKNGLSANELTEIAQALVGEASSSYERNEVYAIATTMWNRLATNVTAKGDPKTKLKTYNRGGTKILGTNGILSEYDAYTDTHWGGKARKDNLRRGDGKLADVKRENGGFIPKDSYLCDQLSEAIESAPLVGNGYSATFNHRGGGITHNLGVGPKPSSDLEFVFRIANTRFYRLRNLTF